MVLLAKSSFSNQPAFNLTFSKVIFKVCSCFQGTTIRGLVGCCNLPLCLTVPECIAEPTVSMSLQCLLITFNTWFHECLHHLFPRETHYWSSSADKTESLLGGSTRQRSVPLKPPDLQLFNDLKPQRSGKESRERFKVGLN